MCTQAAGRMRGVPRYVRSGKMPSSGRGGGCSQAPVQILPPHHPITSPKINLRPCVLSFSPPPCPPISTERGRPGHTGCPPLSAVVPAAFGASTRWAGRGGAPTFSARVTAGARTASSSAPLSGDIPGTVPLLLTIPLLLPGPGIPLFVLFPFPV